MIIFDGKAEAAARKENLSQKIKKLPQLRIYSLVFQEDNPSIIYTRLKKKDALSIGIAYQDTYLSIGTPLPEIQKLVKKISARSDVQGVIVQKPSKELIPSAEWWTSIVSQIAPAKDVDGLTASGTVLPATAKAVMEILSRALSKLGQTVEGKTAVVLGRSDIVGRPVAKQLKKKGMLVHLMGRQDFLEKGELLKTADLVVTATGIADLVTASMLKPGVIVIDAGSPKSEVSPVGLEQVASFHSPVPGGVGPMTRVCLLENLLDMVQSLK